MPVIGITAKNWAQSDRVVNPEIHRRVVLNVIWTVQAFSGKSVGSVVADEHRPGSVAPDQPPTSNARPCDQQISNGWRKGVYRGLFGHRWLY